MLAPQRPARQRAEAGGGLQDFAGEDRPDALRLGGAALGLAGADVDVVDVAARAGRKEGDDVRAVDESRRAVAGVEVGRAPYLGAVYETDDGLLQLVEPGKILAGTEVP